MTCFLCTSPAPRAGELHGEHAVRHLLATVYLSGLIDGACAKPKPLCEKHQAQLRELLAMVDDVHPGVLWAVGLGPAPAGLDAPLPPPRGFKPPPTVEESIAKLEGMRERMDDDGRTWSELREQLLGERIGVPALLDALLHRLQDTTGFAIDELDEHLTALRAERDAPVVPPPPYEPGPRRRGTLVQFPGGGNGRKL